MSEFLVIANLKTGLLTQDLVPYLNEINKYDGNNLVICPTSIYVPYFLKQKYKVGLQNIFYENSNSNTGEITPKQAHSLGIKYVIVGHSQRRKLNETDMDVNKKIIESLKQGLKVILCVGETKEEHDMMKTSIILKKQLVHALKNVSDLNNVIIAYEPIWSIETGKLPNNQDIISVSSYIKQIVFELYNYDDIKIIYGGSIDDNNIDMIRKIPNICGVMIGTSALNAKTLLTIMDKCR